MFNKLHVVIAFGPEGEWCNKDNKIPFISKEDMQHFARTTQNQIVMMGSGTYKSLVRIDPNPLPGRAGLYVITSNANLLASKNEYFKFVTYDDAMEIIASQTVYLIGGYELAKGLSDKVDVWHISNVHADYIVQCPDMVKHNWRKDLNLGTLRSVATHEEFTYLEYNGIKVSNSNT